MATETTKNLNLYQRLQRVHEAVAKVQPTGHNQFKASAISIADVEGAVGPALAEHGVVTIPQALELTDIAEGKLWRIKLEIDFINADDPADHRATPWENIGGNPDAAASFAKKAVYKALFHIVEDDEAGANTVATHNGQRVNRSTGEIKDAKLAAVNPTDAELSQLISHEAVASDVEPAAVVAWLKDQYGLKADQRITESATPAQKAEMIAALKERAAGVPA